MRRLIGICLIWVFLVSCEEIAPSAEIPIFVKLEEVTLTDLSGQRINNPPGIRDVWVYDLQSFQGAYSLSNTFPVLPPENGILRLEAGIFVDGLSSFRRAYPFLQPTEVEVSVDPADTLRLRPNFRYFAASALEIPFSESFEGGVSKLVTTISDPNSTRIIVTSEDSFTGSASGKVTFNSSQNLMFLQSNAFFPLPQGNAEDVFVEISYRNSVPFTVGLNVVSNSGTQSLTHPVTYSGSDNWNTVFVYLTPLLDNVPLNSVFQLFISANSGGSSGTIFLDNVRIIHLSP